MQLPEYVEKHADAILLARHNYWLHENDPPVYIYFNAKEFYPFNQRPGLPLRFYELTATIYGMVIVLDDRLTPNQFIITKEPLHG